MCGHLQILMLKGNVEFMEKICMLSFVGCVYSIIVHIINNEEYAE